MALFTDEMTIFNHYVEDNVDKWKRTIVKGVQWRHGKRETVISSTVVNESISESVTIDFEANYGNEAFVDSRQFDGSIGWTLDSTREDDVVVLGGVNRDITSTYTLKDLKHDYYVGRIASVSDNRNRSRLKHIKVVVK